MDKKQSQSVEQQDEVAVLSVVKLDTEAQRQIRVIKQLATFWTCEHEENIWSSLMFPGCVVRTERRAKEDLRPWNSLRRSSVYPVLSQKRKTMPWNESEDSSLTSA